MKIKQIEEDFYVEEDFEPRLSEGAYAYFTLKKKGWSTIDALYEVASKLHIPFKWLGYCGNKDKKAVTKQYVSGYKINKEQLEKLKIKDIEIKFLGYGKERITLGSNKGNSFSIVVRDLDREIKVENKRILNLFDEQRFGINDMNLKTGKVIVKGNFKEACELLELKADGNDYVGALMKVEKKRLKFCVNAYQSYLWNKVVSDLKNKYEKVPLVGFLSELDGEIEERYKGIMKEERISKEQFMIKAIREIASEGGERGMFVEPRELEIKWGDDELNIGKKKAIVSFWLPKGAYATHVVRELLKH